MAPKKNKPGRKSFGIGSKGRAPRGTTTKKAAKTPKTTGSKAKKSAERAATKAGFAMLTKKNLEAGFSPTSAGAKAGHTMQLRSSQVENYMDRLENCSQEAGVGQQAAQDHDGGHDYWAHLGRQLAGSQRRRARRRRRRRHDQDRCRILHDGAAHEAREEALERVPPMALDASISTMPGRIESVKRRKGSYLMKGEDY